MHNEHVELHHYCIYTFTLQFNSALQQQQQQKQQNGRSTPQPGTSQNGQTENGEQQQPQEEEKVPDDIFDFYEKMDRDDEDDMELKTVSFEINQDNLESLQKRCQAFDNYWVIL